MSRASSTASFAAIIVGDRVRQEGPFELWNADLAGRRLALRRVSKELGDAPAIRRALAFASATAQRVAHENVVLCHGLISISGEDVQISERREQIDFERLAKEPIDPRQATWMIRQLLDPIVHAQSMEISHNNIMPRHVYAALDGAIRLDFGIMRAASGGADQTSINGLGDAAYEPMFVRDGRQHPPPDLYAVAAIWFELLTGKRYFDVLKERRGEHPRTELAPAIDHALGRALDGRAKDPFLDAKTFASTVARIFYVDLDADDDHHGASALIDRVAKAIGVVAPKHKVDLDAMTNPEAAPPRGAFTQMLEERARPVEPKPLSMDDHDSQVVEPGVSTWTPGRSIPAGSGLQGQPMPNHSGTLTPSLASPRVPRPAFPVWVKWFVLGFVLTFIGLRVFHA